MAGGGKEVRAEHEPFHPVMCEQILERRRLTAFFAVEICRTIYLTEILT